LCNVWVIKFIDIIFVVKNVNEVVWTRVQRKYFIALVLVL